MFFIYLCRMGIFVAYGNIANTVPLKEYGIQLKCNFLSAGGLCPHSEAAFLLFCFYCCCIFFFLFFIEQRNRQVHYACESSHYPTPPPICCCAVR